MNPTARRILHLGCSTKRKDHTLPVFQSDDWQEVRFDIDKDVLPGFVGSRADMPENDLRALAAR
jgi:hypothetical protein